MTFQGSRVVGNTRATGYAEEQDYRSNQPNERVHQGLPSELLIGSRRENVANAFRSRQFNRITVQGVSQAIVLGKICECA